MFFSYIHCRPNGSPFYVGKGREKRVYDFNSNRNKYYKRIINLYGKDSILIGKLACSSEQIAFNLERGLIKIIKANRITLTNMTDGGEGMSGFKPSKEYKEKMSEKLKGRKFTKEHLEKISASLKGRKLSEKAKQLMREKKQGHLAPMKGKFGNLHPFFGKKHSEDARYKISKANLGKKKPRTICSICGESSPNNLLKRNHELNCKIYGDSRETKGA